MLSNLLLRIVETSLIHSDRTWQQRVTNTEHFLTASFVMASAARSQIVLKIWSLYWPSLTASSTRSGLSKLKALSYFSDGAATAVAQAQKRIPVSIKHTSNRDVDFISYPHYSLFRIHISVVMAVLKCENNSDFRLPGVIVRSSSQRFLGLLHRSCW